MAKYSVFIVDDDPAMCAIMSTWLQAAGHGAASDTAASTAIPRIKADKPDAVLVDLMMAEVDGLELIKELRDRPVGESAAIIMVSTRTDDIWRQRAKEMGADGYLTKPLEQVSFVEDIEQLVARKKSRE